MKPMSPWQFTLFRLIFGSYLIVHFAQLAPWAAELFGPTGMLPDPSENPTYGIFLNPLNWPLSEAWITTIVVALTTLSALFTLGLWRKPAAILLWFGSSAFFHRNNLISNPSIPYVSLLLILTTLVPSGEPLSRGKLTPPWSMPRWVYRTAWILMASGYSFSGFTKLDSPSWLDGTAIRRLLDNPLAHSGWVRDFFLSLPESVLSLMTWTILAAELLFLPLALWARSRPWIWLTMVAMHLGILGILDFADLSLGMLMIHLFTFDPDWLPSKATSRHLLAFDGECMMCSRAIQFLAAEDQADMLRFTPLQSGRGQELEKRARPSHSIVPAQESILVDTGSAVFARSSAVLVALEVLGGHWRILAQIGRLIPPRLRDAAYDLVARHRKDWFRNRQACALPSEALRRRLIS
ncbi:MAG: DCC1-like thiol-disulfide oxidoreductase family protein [Verrucomicrobiales bacterium]